MLNGTFSDKVHWKLYYSAPAHALILVRNKYVRWDKQSITIFFYNELKHFFSLLKIYISIFTFYEI